MIGQSRDSAWSLLTEYTQSESLRKHAKAVEACMRAYARKFAREQGLSPSATDELEHKYSVTALLHDFDYERFPTPEHLGRSPFPPLPQAWLGISANCMSTAASR